MSTFTGKVIEGGLNMRKTASSSATILVQIPDGTALTLIEESGKTAWFKTTYGSYTGYVMAAYIAITDDGGTCQVTTASGDLNVRKTPSSSASVLYKAARNSTIRLLDCTSNADWYRVSSANGTGWAMSDYLTILTEPGEEEETPTVSSDTTATVRYNSTYCYKTADLDSNNVVGTLAANTSIPIWFVHDNNEYYQTSMTVNGVATTGYVYSGDVTLAEDNTGTLSNGSSGNSVINCKWRLFELGYHPHQFSKNFDGILEASVRVFQEKNSITETGTINSATRTAMNASSTLTWAEKVGSWTSFSAPYQWFMNDANWSSYAFPATANPTGTIGGDGNSITAMAMLLTAFAGCAVTPVEMAEFALGNNLRDQDGYTGVVETFYTTIGNHYTCVSYDGKGDNLSAVKTHLANGGTLAIIEVNNNNSTFTAGASQLVCYNIDGYVYALSPNSNKNPDPFTEEEWAEAGWFRTAYLYTICNG